MTSRLDHPRGFTIVELLVVIGVITLLLALLAPALSGVRTRGQLTTQTSNLRQVGMAWNMYANSNNNAIMPGYIDFQGTAGGALGMWTVTFRDPNGQPLADELAAPWPWRLWPYLDNASFLLDYKADVEVNKMALLSEFDLRQDLALRPRFGYNAYYMGGWYERVETDSSSPLALPKFYNATDMSDNSINVVARSMGALKRPADLVTFTSAADYEPDVYIDILENRPGAHTVTPPTLGDEQRWSRFGDDGSTMEVFVDTKVDPIGGAPARRISRQFPVLFADMHTDLQNFGALDDLRRWIDSADREDFEHLPSP